MIKNVWVEFGIGDALNARSFLVEYCKQKNYPRKNIKIYTKQHWWMFEGMGFVRAEKKEGKLTPFNNFGYHDLNKDFKIEKLDDCIAKNAGINYSFDVRTPFQDFGPCGITLPKRYVTLNTGFGKFSGRENNPDYVCTKSWPLEHWKKLVNLLDVPCVQIGAGASVKPVVNVAMNLVDKTTIQETATVLRGALFHIDMEGGLPILNQHLGGKSVVLFGPTAIQNQGRSYNLNICANTCVPCYEWGTHKYGLCVHKRDLKCHAHCMSDITPEMVVEEIYKAKWL